MKVAVFASGGGTTLQALLDHAARPEHTAWSVALVVSDRAESGALTRAADAGVPSVVIRDRGRPPEDVAAETLGYLEQYDVDLVALAGYLRLLPPRLVRAYEGRMVNVHPSLLPAFGGAGMYGRLVHEAVVASGVRVTGMTVHLVDLEYDTGRPLAQWPVPVHPTDGPADVAARVQAVERAVYPRVLDHLSETIARGEETVPYHPFPPNAHFQLAPDASPTSLDPSP